MTLYALETENQYRNEKKITTPYMTNIRISHDEILTFSVRPPIHYKPRAAGVQYTGKKKEFRANAETGKHNLSPLTGWSII